MIIRIESKLDQQTQRFFIEIYHPANAEVPFITSHPQYGSPVAAEQDVLAILAATASMAANKAS